MIKNQTVLLEDLQEQIKKLREEGEVPETLDLIRQIEKADQRLKKPPKKNWVH